MKKPVIIIAVITIFFIALGFIVKSKYYYLPYPNLPEYFLSFILLMVTLAVNRRSKGHLKSKVLISFTSVAVLLGVINLLNLIFEWHPLNLNLPFSKTQSFEVDFEPYEWETASPEAYGYSNEVLSDFFAKTAEWERLRGLLVVKDGKLIIEKYSAGATKYSAFNVHSVTKSITSALVGIAIQ